MIERMRRRTLEPATENPWTCLERSSIAETPGFRVRQDSVIGPDGARGRYTFVESSSSFSVVVALDGAGRVTLVRQWRYPWGESSWEAPAGHIEPGETPLAAAQRELAEEAGLAAASWQPLAVLHPTALDPVRSHLFLASDLRDVPEAREGSERDMLLRRLPLAAALAAAEAGDVIHAMTVSALFLAERALARRAVDVGATDRL